MNNFDLHTPDGMAKAAAWLSDHLSRIKDGGTWILPRSSTMIHISHQTKTARVVFELVHEKCLEKVFQQIHWTFHPMGEVKSKHDLKISDRWPALMAIIEPENCFNFLLECTQQLQRQENKGEGMNMRQALHNYLIAMLETSVPPDQIIDALAETLSATIIKAIRDKDDLKGGWKCL